ncbi:MAG: DUF2934 domain-containing protein [Rhodospirillales bacterium]
MSKTLQEMTLDFQTRIQELAYSMWEQAGRQQGMAVQYWLEAEKQALAAMHAATSHVMSRLEEAAPLATEPVAPPVVEEPVAPVPDPQPVSAPPPAAVEEPLPTLSAQAVPPPAAEAAAASATPRAPRKPAVRR